MLLVIGLFLFSCVAAQDTIAAIYFSSSSEKYIVTSHAAGILVEAGPARPPSGAQPVRAGCQAKGVSYQDDAMFAINLTPQTADAALSVSGLTFAVGNVNPLGLDLCLVALSYSCAPADTDKCRQPFYHHVSPTYAAATYQVPVTDTDPATQHGIPVSVQGPFSNGAPGHSLHLRVFVHLIGTTSFKPSDYVYFAFGNVKQKDGTFDPIQVTGTVQKGGSMVNQSPTPSTRTQSPSLPPSSFSPSDDSVALCAVHTDCFGCVSSSAPPVSCQWSLRSRQCTPLDGADQQNYAVNGGQCAREFDRRTPAPSAPIDLEPAGRTDFGGVYLHPAILALIAIVAGVCVLVVGGGACLMLHSRSRRRSSQQRRSSQEHRSMSRREAAPASYRASKRSRSSFAGAAAAPRLSRTSGSEQRSQRRSARSKTEIP